MEEIIYFEKNGKKFAVMYGEEREINTDKNGNEFFTLPQDCHGRLDIAMELVEKGEADNLIRLEVAKQYTPPEFIPIRFVNREKGQEINKKCLEKNKNLNFKYSIEISYKGISCLLASDCVDFALGKKANDYILFDTLEEAEDFCDNTLDELEDKLNINQMSVGDAILFNQSQLWKLVQDAHNNNQSIDLIPFAMLYSPVDL